MYNLNNNFALTYSTENKLKRQNINSNGNSNNKKIIKNQKSPNIEHKSQQKSYKLHNNTFFWIIYVMIYGIEEYNLLSQKQYFSKEQEIRYILIDKIQKLPTKKIDFLKAHKIKPQTIISELGNSTSLSLNTFIGLSIILNMNVLLVKNCIAQLLLNNDNDTNVWNININKIKIVDCSNTIKKYESDYYLVDTIIKPFKAISAYKAEELRTICEKVCIVTKNDKNKNKTKKELYQELIDKIEI